MSEPAPSAAPQDDLVRELEALHAASFGWALACCRRDRESAQEALQAAYCKVLSGQVRFDGRASVKTWLFGVIRLTALEQRRWAWTRWLLGNKPALDPPPAQRGPDQALADREEEARLSRALAGLAARQREVLHLVFYEELTVAEAAAIMGVSVGAARQHYERGKKNLGERLRPKGVER